MTMTKIEAYRVLSNMHRGIAFVANVIFTRGGQNTAKRLKTMVRLIQTGHELNSAPFSCDHLTIDGSIVALASLDAY
jgi:hypothetical protein